MVILLLIVICAKPSKINWNKNSQNLRLKKWNYDNENYYRTLVKKISKNQNGMSISKIKEAVSISTNIEICLLGIPPKIHPKSSTPLLKFTDSNSSKLSCCRISKAEAQLAALQSMWVAKYLPSNLKYKKL